MIGVIKRSMTKLSQVNPKGGELSDTELETLFIRVEGLMNSRPLTATVSNTEHDSPLTPNHFILGNGNSSPLRLTIPENLRDDLVNQYNWKYMRIEEEVSKFWQRMTTEYMEQARQRPKWNKGDVQLEPGTLVMVMDEFKERIRWPLAEVLECERDASGLIQTVKIKYKGNETRRGIRSLAPVPLFN